jgi:glucose/arabinose dehydrogenase
MLRFFWVSALLLLGEGAALAGQLPKPMLTGLKNPQSVAVGADGRVYFSEIGAPDKDGDGRILVVDHTGKAQPFATGLDGPKGIVSWQKSLFVADKKRVWRIDDQGKAQIFAAKEAFPTEPQSLCDIAVDETGILYVSDSGDLKGNGGAIYRIDHRGRVKAVADSRSIPSLKMPKGLLLDGLSHLLVLDFGSGELLRVRISDGSGLVVAEGLEGGTGLAWDWFGQLFITSGSQGKVWGIARPGQKPVLIASGFESAADPCLDPTGKSILIPDTKSGTLTALPATVPGNEVDASPIALAPVPAFPQLNWTGWQAVTEQGKAAELRPIFLTHAGDGSQRNFVIIQQGTIHVFPNDPNAQKTKIFLDIRDRVLYSDNENEQGLLGMAFHPNYKNNGEFFVFYSVRKPKLTNVLSRFRVSKEDPDKADPNSEEELLRLSRPFWNHDGGTICFGPDGHLYVVVGDGGAANDPFKNGQNLKTLLGKILRIDVNGRDGGKKYGIPKDNPFVDTPGHAPEIWAYGVRNPWRIAFDRKTGWLWAGDVGQNLYEEIDIITKGGNYGWNIREGFHPFSVNGVGPRKDLQEPIWEYHHDVGKSITGGTVYRGKKLPELEGHYVYGDYVSSRIWALKYDDGKRRVVANRPLAKANVPIFSFGEDERGELYLLGPSVSGQGIFRFEAPTTRGE